MAHEFALSYGLLLLRQWLSKVCALGNYKRDTYLKSDGPGVFRAFHQVYEKGTNAVEIPRIGLAKKGEHTPAIEQETQEDLDTIESAGESEKDIMTYVLGQATRAMREQ